ncbi:uncharacterized protein METZ01_LOCUS193956 [marine metagenome]|uniref:Uncharacterized protein n=1 Tax=marine metagenome TaxID=408172 RepID=A0A382DSP5_9ZZZZ
MIVSFLSKSAPQKRHLLASDLTNSAQSGHFFNSPSKSAF